MKGERNEKALKLGYIGFQGRCGCRTHLTMARTQMLFGWLGHEENGQGTGGRCVLTSNDGQDTG